MNAEPGFPRGATGRADLLRALAVAERDLLVIDDDGRDRLAYVLRRTEPKAPPVTAGPIPGPAPRPRPLPARRLPLRLPFVHSMVEREPRERPETRPEAEGAAASARPLIEADLEAASKVRLVEYQDLVPAARLLPALRRLLGATRPGPLDLERIAERLAFGALPRRLPRRPLRRWPPDLIVLLDFSPRLWPYREDMHRLAERLLGHCGRSRVRLRILDRGPFGPWSDWLAHQDPASGRLPPARPWVMPMAGTPVLIVSDLGLLTGAGSRSDSGSDSGAGSGLACAWGDFVTALVRARVRPLALAPIGARQPDAGLPLPILRWSPDAPARPSHGHGIGQTEPAGLDDLLAMVAATRRVDPPLLRALRRLNPRAPLDAGLEGALWCHPDVEAGTAAAVRRETQARHLAHFARFARSLPHLHGILNALRRRHHAHLRAFLDHEETLLWETHAAPAAAEEFAGDIKKAKNALGRLSRTLERPGGLDSVLWWELALGIEGRADARMGRRHQVLLAPLVAARVRWVRARGGEPTVPEWTDPAVLSGLLAGPLGDDRAPTECWLVRDAASGCLLLQAEPAGRRQSPLGGSLLLDAGGAQVQVGEGDHAARQWVWTGALPVALARLDALASIRVETAREVVTVAAVRRPLGALEWGCDNQGIAVRSASLGKWEMRWVGEALRGVRLPEGGEETPAWALEADAAVTPDLPLASGGRVEFGMDARFGVYADLHIATEQGSATQRLRWIEPGSFLMGSPEDEPERLDSEGPQHQVTLTQGFWLADTACTQGLWQAVTGANPSHFTGDPERPVEQVGWQDVQGFLRKLEAVAPGCRAALPTEAQWEYACRAGTDTAFSFGEQITPEQVNYDGNYPYAGGEKGLYREQTAPVKSLPPNPWGLYEMHGNVWEWCADGQRAYDSEPREDPTGPVLEAKDASRVVRGGSWINGARFARSAYRGGGTRASAAASRASVSP